MLRLQIISTGQFLVMDQTTSLTIEKNMTLFNDSDEFLGSLTYDGKLPLEPNKAILKNKHYINTLAKDRELDVLAYLGYLPYKQVKFTYTIENGAISYTLLIDNGIIASQLKTLKLNQVSIVGDNDMVSPGSFQALADYMLQTAKAEPGKMPMVFFPYKNDGAYVEIAAEDYSKYPDIAFPVNPYINAWDIANQKFVVDVAGADVSQTQTPFFYLAYILKRVLKFLGFTYDGRWLDDPQVNRICIGSQVPINANIIADSFTYMPDINLSDWFKAIRTEFGLVIDFDQTRKVCIVESLRYLRSTNKVVDLQNAQIKSYRELPVATSGYLISRNPDDKDNAYTDADKENLPEIRIGDGMSDIELTSCSTKMIIENGPVVASAAAWKIPYIKQPVYGQTPLDQISSVGESDRNNFKLRWLYYHGMQKDAGGFLYPFGSSDNTDQAGKVLTNFNLELVGSGSAYQALKDRYQFLVTSKPYEQGFKLTRQQFFSITPDARIITRDINNAAVINLIDQLNADITDKQVIMATAVLYPIVWPDNLPGTIPAEPPPPPVVDPPVDNGQVYAKLVIKNVQSTYHQYPAPGYTYKTWDIYVQFYADAAWTTPKPVINLPVRYQVDEYDKTAEQNNGGSGHTYSQNTVVCNGSEAALQLNAPQSTTQGGFYDWNYTLLASSAYTIIS